MAQKQTARRPSMAAKAPAGEGLGWSEFWQKEDWWAIWLGLGLVIAAIVAYLAGGTIKPLAIKPSTWDSFTTLWDHFAAQYYWYLLQFLLLAAVLGISAWAMGWKLNEFLPSFLFVYAGSLIIFAIGLSGRKLVPIISSHRSLPSFLASSSRTSCDFLPGWMRVSA